MEFADAYATDHVGQLPGLKSPPQVATEPDLETGVNVGELAPDLLLVPRERPGQRWLLSDERGRSVTIAILPPGCQRCGRAVESDGDVTQGSIILLGDGSAGDDGATERMEFAWSPDVGRLFAPSGDLQLIEIDPRGVILSISGMLE